MAIRFDLLAAAGTALSYGEGPSVPWARIVLAFLLWFLPFPFAK